MSNLGLWNSVAQPPTEYLKKIRGGRLNGMTDISPMWRYMELTSRFGMCGIGWKYTVDDQWVEEGHGGERFAFVNINLFVKQDGEWSDGIFGTGGHKLVSSESRGMHNNDEAFKMATTDAIGTACKLLGFGADIYMGRFDGSKYANADQGGSAGKSVKKKIRPDQTVSIIRLAKTKELSEENVAKAVKFANSSTATEAQADEFIKKLESLKDKSEPENVANDKSKGK